MSEGGSSAVLEAICAVGLDGCRAGWVAALAFGDSHSPSHTALRLFDCIDSVIDWYESQGMGSVVAIDVPIGLPRLAGVRQCDREARNRLGRRWMCVFAPPDRELFGLDFHAAREVVHRRRAERPAETFHVLSQQAVQITGKISEVDRVLCAELSRQEWLVEVHPEVSFRELAGVDLPRKKSSAGRNQRLSLLRNVFSDIDERLGEVPWLRREVASDDLLDAYAALWSALRFARGAEHYVLLGDGQKDERGLPMRMVV